MQTENLCLSDIIAVVRSLAWPSKRIEPYAAVEVLGHIHVTRSGSVVLASHGIEFLTRLYPVAMAGRPRWLSGEVVSQSAR